MNDDPDRDLSSGVRHTVTGCPDAASAVGVDELKRSVRLDARERRKATTDRGARSVRICSALLRLDAVVAAERVLAYSPMGSEVDVGDFVARCRAEGKEVRVPEDDVDPAWPDVIVVPGLAFTVDGRRLGQGAGWYDRFLPARRPDCLTIGVGFATQLLDDMPTAPHDVILDHIVTD